MCVCACACVCARACLYARDCNVSKHKIAANKELEDVLYTAGMECRD